MNPYFAHNLVPQECTRLAVRLLQLEEAVLLLAVEELKCFCVPLQGERKRRRVPQLVVDYENSLLVHVVCRRLPVDYTQRLLLHGHYLLTRRVLVHGLVLVLGLLVAILVDELVVLAIAGKAALFPGRRQVHW